MQYLIHMKIVDLHNDIEILQSVWTTELPDPIHEIQKRRLHIEDAWFITPDNIDQVISMRPYSIGLTWNHDNALAGGAHGTGRLTDWGRTVIKQLTDANIKIDLAHLNRPSFFDVAAILKGTPLLCTHTCFDEVHPHPRNLTRDQIQTIVDGNGLVGLTLVGRFLGGRRFRDIYKHIKYFIDNFGENNLGIGTDFTGVYDLPYRLKKYTHFARLRRYLSRHGIKNETIDKIFEGNFHEWTRKS